jgi:plastocyanin
MGLAIVVITLAVGAAILVPFFHDFYKNPPPVTQVRRAPAPSEQPQTGGPTIISIPSGASAQGNPSFEPNPAKVPIEGVGSEIVWDNLDTVPHTATSGTGVDDANKGKLFDTSFINPNAKSANIVLKGVSVGDVIDYFCTVHPFMKGQLNIVAAGQGAQSGGTGGGTAGITLNILEGASAQGSPDFDPDPLKAKVGDTIHVVNKDTVPHTVTSGKGADDADKGKLFDTSFINGGKSADITLDKVSAGEVDYFCTVHPYMTGKMTVE